MRALKDPKHLKYRIPGYTGSTRHILSSLEKFKNPPTELEVEYDASLMSDAGNEPLYPNNTTSFDHSKGPAPLSAASKTAKKGGNMVVHGRNMVVHGRRGGAVGDKLADLSDSIMKNLTVSGTGAKTTKTASSIRKGKGMMNM